MEPAPSSFSGPPLSLPRVPAYDHGELLPQREGECAAHSGATPPHQKPRTRPHSSRHEHIATREDATIQAHSPTPPSPWGEEKQQVGGNGALAPWSRAAANLFIPSSNLTPRLPLSPTSPPSGGPRAAMGGRGASTARSAGGDQQLAPVRHPGASSPRRQQQFLSMSSPTSPASPHRALLALQANMTLQSNTIDRHSPFGRSYNSLESEWPGTPSSSSSSPSATARSFESLSRMDAMIRQRMDQTARIRSGTHLAILDSLYTNASGALTPRSPGASSPTSERKREMAREMFDPAARWERVRKVHANAAAKEAASRAAILERSDERRRERVELAKANAEVERRNREERAKTHDLYERIKAERVTRKTQEKDQAEAAEKEAIERRKREHAKLADFIRQHAEGLASAGFKDREAREREQTEATERQRKREADRWAATQQKWKIEGEEAKRAREAKEAKERAAQEEVESDRREHAARARKERDSRIAAKILVMQEQAKAARENADQAAAREEATARREREAYTRARDALAEEARKKTAERSAAREEQAARAVEERVARQRALQLLASKNLRATIRANSPPSSPKRQHSPRRSQSPVGDAPPQPQP